MKTHQYLTSGILESYLLGLVSNDQRKDVEHVLTTDPDVVQQLNELEDDLENHFMRHAVPPPPSVRNAVLERINETSIKKWQYQDVPHTDFEAPRSESAKSNYVDVEVNNTHLSVHKNWRAAFIAVFVLSKIFLIMGLYFYFKSSSLEQEVSRLKAETQQMKSVQRGQNP